MKIFFDTEFTGLHKDTTLISIGLVSEDGKEFYAELTDYDCSQVEDFVRENVFPNLISESNGFHAKKMENVFIIVSEKEIVANALKNWLSQFDYVELYSDCCHFDMVLFIDLFSNAWGIPHNVCPSCHDINQDIAKYLNVSNMKAFDYSRNELSGMKDNDHNALCDARKIKAIYEKIHQ